MPHKFETASTGKQVFKCHYKCESFLIHSKHKITPALLLEDQTLQMMPEWSFMGQAMFVPCYAVVCENRKSTSPGLKWL